MISGRPQTPFLWYSEPRDIGYTTVLSESSPSSITDNQIAERLSQEKPA